ncbi:MAG: LacI family DNA-binding transcriptional regulator, partial [Cetobacterium sp.]
MATIKDVAKLAGLSITTVSRYLNNHPYITEEKRESIQRAMKELDYVPSSVATTLRSNKGKMIGILVSRITNPYFSYLIDAV